MRSWARSHKKGTMLIITSEAAQKAELGTPNPKQQTSIDHRCDERMAIVGRFPGGRPLRRRREMVLIFGRLRLRGTAALQVATDHRCQEPMVIAGQPPGGRPLRRRREMVLVCGRRAARDRSPPETDSARPAATFHSSTLRAPAPEEPRKLRFGRASSRPRRPGTGKESQSPIWMQEYCFCLPRCRSEPAR